MGYGGGAAIAGYAEWRPRVRKDITPKHFTVEQWALLAKQALDDAGIAPGDVDGIVTAGFPETPMMAPATVAEYLGVDANFAEYVDLGGATSAGMIWRAAAAIDLGLANVVLCTVPGTPLPDIRPTSAGGRTYLGALSDSIGSAQAEFEIPFGNVGQNAAYATIAQRYGAEYGYDERAMAKIAVDQRTNAITNPEAVFFGKPLTIEDVLASPFIAEPLHMLEIVMRCAGGASVVVARTDIAEHGPNRAVRIAGFGEGVSHKTPTYARDMTVTSMTRAADTAFGMAGVSRDVIDMVSVYDCYTITVLLTLEDAGFCKKGEGQAFIADHDLTWRGNFPCNTHGGQLSFGQPGIAGGMSHVCDATRQLMGRAEANQVAGARTAFVAGTGGLMSEQVALVLEAGS
jgi:acetyl-CoA acetyltransferase